MPQKQQNGDVQYKTLTQNEDDGQTRQKRVNKGKKKSVLQSFFARKSALWALFLVTLMYSNNQLNRFILSSVANKLEQNANFGNGNGACVLCRVRLKLSKCYYKVICQSQLRPRIIIRGDLTESQPFSQSRPTVYRFEYEAPLDVLWSPM